MPGISEILLRTFLALAILFALARVMGRRSVAQLTLYDYVLGLIFGNIGASLAVDKSVGIIEGIVSLFACTVWILVVNNVMLKNIPARKLVEPEPVLVLYNGAILEDNLRKNYYTVNSLLELLREEAVFDPSTVSLGILESDGQLSLIKNENGKNNETQSSQPIQMDEFSLHMSGRALIIDGALIERNFEEHGINTEQLMAHLTSRNIDVKDVMVALLTPEGKLYIDTNNDKLAFEKAHAEGKTDNKH